MKYIVLGIAGVAFIISTIYLLANEPNIANGIYWMCLSLFNLICFGIRHICDEIKKLK